ncbi:MAG: tripartite tricarboxylate transporter substrate binding protein [Deltaproteobacteria bacterium]
MKKNLLFRLMSLALISTAFGLYPTSAPAQTYPTKPINFIVPFPAGTGNDVIARTIGDKLAKSLGKPVVVDNKAGATGAIAGEAAAKSLPDGYTIFIPSTTLSINMSVSKVNYDLVKDFTPVALVGVMPNSLLVPSSLPVKSIKELIELAKSKPGQLNFGSNGFGGAPHLLAEMLKIAGQIDIVHVAYKGTNEVVADLLAGRVQLLFAPLTTGIPLIKDGRLRILGVCSDKRSPALPDVPTMGEVGYPALAIPNWYSVMAPAGTPKAIIANLNAEITKIMAMGDVKERLANLGVESRSSTPEEAAAYIKQDVAKWAKVIKDAGVQMK